MRWMTCSLLLSRGNRACEVVGRIPARSSKGAAERCVGDHYGHPRELLALTRARGPSKHSVFVRTQLAEGLLRVEEIGSNCTGTTYVIINFRSFTYNGSPIAIRPDFEQ